MQSFDGLLQLAIEAQALSHIIPHLVVLPQQALKALLNCLQPYRTKCAVNADMRENLCLKYTGVKKRAGTCVQQTQVY